MSDEWIFPESDGLTSDPACSSPSLLLDGDSYTASHLWLETSKDTEPDQAAETQMATKDIFTFSSRPRSAPHGKSHDMSPKECPFTVDPKEDSRVTKGDTELEGDFYGSDSSEEVHNLMSKIGLKHGVPLVPVSIKRVGMKEGNQLLFIKTQQIAMSVNSSIRLLW